MTEVAPVALITGAARGIGAASARLLADRGWRIVGFDGGATDVVLPYALADPDELRVIGAQMIGGEGIKERADFLAMAARTGITIEQLATMENVYSPAIGALNEPMAVAAQNLLGSL